MKLVRLAYVVVLGVSALGAICVSGASAHEFTATVTGKGKVVKNNAQVFTMSGTTVECTEVGADSNAESGSHPAIALSLLVKKCEFKALGGLIKAAATTVLADDTFFAEPEVGILNVNILADVPSVSCSITVFFGQKLGKGAGELTYENKGNNVLLKSNVKDIEWSRLNEGSGSCAAGTTGRETGATYSGEVEIGVEGGIISWK